MSDNVRILVEVGVLILACDLWVAWANWYFEKKQCEFNDWRDHVMRADLTEIAPSPADEAKP